MLPSLHDRLASRRHGAVDPDHQAAIYKSIQYGGVESALRVAGGGTRHDSIKPQAHPGAPTVPAPAGKKSSHFSPKYGR